MSWHFHVKSAERVLESSRVPPSEEIISLIKRINPTKLHLAENDRKHGYRIKNRLQNLLLENYGAAFHLVPHPLSPDIILIKHNVLPSIDACHADLNAISAKAFDTVGSAPCAAAETPAKAGAKVKSKRKETDDAPKEVLRNAELLLEQYEYTQAEHLLASLRVSEARDLPILLKAAGMLVEDMGAYQRAIEVLLAQPRQLLKDQAIRELLALTYYGNGMIPEARALFDAAVPGELGKNALHAYADISFKDGNLLKAYHMVKLSETREGFLAASGSLRKEIEAAMLEDAEPFFQEAERACGRNETAQATSLLEKALAVYPNFQKARQLAAEIETSKTSAELERLWQRLAACETGADRLDLLTQLLERDRSNGEKVKNLIAEEKAGQKREAVQGHLAALRTLAAQENWDECFDILLWFSHQGDEGSFRTACQVAPLFAVLYQNRRLQRVPDAEAKELWLKFERLKRPGQRDDMAASWELVQELKPYFNSHTLFKEEHDPLLERVRAKARQEVERLLDRLEGLGEVKDTAGMLAEAKGLVNEMRRHLVVLPVEESALYKEDGDRVLRGLDQQTKEERSILDYREALMLGNLAQAQQVRESQPYPWPPDLVQMVDDIVRDDFAIPVEPMILENPLDLVVDLTTEPGESGLEYICASERHFLFREDDETFVVVNVRRMSATKHRSPNFKDLAVMEIVPDQDLFLFINMANKLTVWRAVLSETESRFTATFEINEHFFYRENACFEGLRIANGKDSVYYGFIREGDKLRAVKQSVGLDSNLVSSFEVKGPAESLSSLRLSFNPDRFVLVTDATTTVLESNLCPSRGCSYVGMTQALRCLGVNTQKSLIYALGDGIIDVLNTRLRAVKQYLQAATAAHMTVTSKADICVDTSTVSFHVEDNRLFYNMQTNMFSQKYAGGRVLSTETPSRWYYWAFDASRPAIIVKDISEEVNHLLKWEVFLAPGQGDEAGEEFVRKLADPDYFTVVKPANRVAG